MRYLPGEVSLNCLNFWESEGRIQVSIEGALMRNEHGEGTRHRHAWPMVFYLHEKFILGAELVCIT